MPDKNWRQEGTSLQM